MGRNKRYIRKAKKFYGICHNTRLNDCKDCFCKNFDLCFENFGLLGKWEARHSSIRKLENIFKGGGNK